MYLFIFEDGEVFKAKYITEGDFDSVDTGILDIIDITDANNPVMYEYGEWHEVEAA